MEIPRPLGIHIPIQLTKNETGIIPQFHVQSKPLDLGIAGRCRKINHNSPPQSAKEFINESNLLNKTESSCFPLMVSNGIEHKSVEQNSEYSFPENMTMSNINLTSHIADSPNTHIHSANTLIDQISRTDCENHSINLIPNDLDASTNVISTPSEHSKNAIIKPVQTKSGDENLPSSSTSSSPAPSTNSIRIMSKSASKHNTDHEKSSSQGRKKSIAVQRRSLHLFVFLVTAPRHLKKAWLQRHNTTEDCETTSKDVTSIQTTVSKNTIAFIDKSVDHTLQYININTSCPGSPENDNGMTGIHSF